MITISWLLGIIIATAIVVLSRIYRWPESQSADAQQLLRFIATCFGVILVITGIFLVQMQFSHLTALANNWSGIVISSSVLVGALFFTYGVFKWHGDIAALMRRVGWIMLLVSFLVPTTITLFIPAIVLLGTLIGKYKVANNDTGAF